MPKQVNRTVANGVLTITTDTDGVKTTTNANVTHAVVNADVVAMVGYRSHKIWNPSTQAYITVNTTGNQAQDAQLLAAAFVTAGERTNSIISST